ncbi:hypothetical protein H0H87_000515, partial [Tephrocybe sp. NHM501043]
MKKTHTRVFSAISAAVTQECQLHDDRDAYIEAIERLAYLTSIDKFVRDGEASPYYTEVSESDPPPNCVVDTISASTPIGPFDSWGRHPAIVRAEEEINELDSLFFSTQATPLPTQTPDVDIARAELWKASTCHDIAVQRFKFASETLLQTQLRVDSLYNETEAMRFTHGLVLSDCSFLEDCIRERLNSTSELPD